MDFPYEKFSHEAMATSFDILVSGKDRQYAGQAAMAAFEEIDNIEKEISKYLDSSDISRINHLKVGESTRVGIHTMACLKASFKVCAETKGAFDVTIGPLMKCWVNPDRSQRQPSAEELAQARARVGSQLLDLNEDAHTVGVKADGVRVDLGGVGKGYAVEYAAGILKEWDIDSAFISGGGSTVYALDAPAGKDGWPVGVGGSGKEAEAPESINMCHKSLSGSGFEVRGHHIMDPHTGKPITDKVATWSLCPSATISDCLSTAFMVMTPAAVEEYCVKHPDTAAMIIMEDRRRMRYGKW